MNGRAAKPREKFPSTLHQSSHGFVTRVHGFATKTNALAREIPPATQAKISQASDRRIFDTVNTLDLMRTSTEFISEISAPTISTSFKFQLDFLVNVGEVDVYHVSHVCICRLDYQPLFGK